MDCFCRKNPLHFGADTTHSDPPTATLDFCFRILQYGPYATYRRHLATKIDSNKQVTVDLGGGVDSTESLLFVVNLNGLLCCNIF